MRPGARVAAATERFGLEPRARIVGTAVAGVEPRIMGIGPVAATRKLLARVGLSSLTSTSSSSTRRFASQALAVLRELGIADDAAHVNAQGGAIALGHPLGASGARLVTTALRQLERSAGRRALCTMCIGVGQGIAMLIERVASKQDREVGDETAELCMRPLAGRARGGQSRCAMPRPATSSRRPPRVDSTSRPYSPMHARWEVRRCAR